METTKILSSTFLDILFDGRNKNYGAYELRTSYNKRLYKALTATGLLVGLFIGATFLNAEDKSISTKLAVGQELTIEKVDIPEKVIPPTPPPPAAKSPEPPKIETVHFTKIKIAADKDVVQPPPSQDDMGAVKIGLDNIEGIKGGNIVIPPSGGIDGGKGIVDVKPTREPDEPFIKVEREAAFRGDWSRFLTTNLRGEIPVDNGAAPGSYQVIVQFVVDVEGNVSDLRIVKDPGFGMAKEAMRVIKKSGKWKPAIQNGNPVKAYRKQPITFQVLDQ